MEIANEFILAAEVGGERQAVDESAAFIFFTWKSQLAPVPAVQTKPPGNVKSPTAASKASTARNSSQATPVVMTGEVATATSTPAAGAAPIPQETSDETWQPVQRQKTPKTTTTTTTKGGGAKKEEKKRQNAETAEGNRMKLKKAIESGNWKAEEPGMSGNLVRAEEVEEKRAEMLPENLRQFCLPGSLVFVFGERPLTTMSALAPKHGNGDAELHAIESLLGAAAKCDAKVERAFAAPGNEERVRWFVELETESETARVIEYINSHEEFANSLEAASAGTLVDISPY
jgi:hypothetical protein